LDVRRAARDVTGDFMVPGYYPKSVVRN
jgi:hypothetical protein